MRLFFAVALPDTVRERLAALVGELREKAPSAPVSWVVPQNLHLTLKFLGEVEDATVPTLKEAAAQVAARMAPFRLVAERIGTFGGRASPRVVWVGVREDDGFHALARVAEALDRVVVPLGVPPDKHPTFKAHITLGRARDGRAPRGRSRGRPKKGEGDLGALVKALDERREFAAGDFAVDRFVLYESRLGGPRPPEYVETVGFDLSGKE